MIGALLTGGTSSRFGTDGVHRDKAAIIGGSVRDALRQAGLDPVVCVGGAVGKQLGLVTIPDRRPGAGPLAGLASLLLWAGPDPALVVPCDLPLLAATHLGPLLAAANDSANVGHAIVARVDGVVHHSIAVWPPNHGRDFWQAVSDGQSAMRYALELVPWRGVEIHPDAVRDADTPGELHRLSPRLADRADPDHR